MSTGWGSALPQRALAEGRLTDLHPLSELPHPVVAKAVESFGAEAADDNFVGPISSATGLRLLEIKQSQWRGGVWQDPDSDVCWLVVAGLAKGGHEDRDDFYNRVKRENDAGDLRLWLPTEQDIRLLKQETAARLRTEWELEVQGAVLDALSEAQAGGHQRIDVDHPVPQQGHMARIDLTVTAVRNDGYEADEVVIDIIPEDRYAGSNLLWQLTLRVLISIEPPEQAWDRLGDSYSNIGEPGTWTKRVDDLTALVQRAELAVSEPGTTCHYTHRDHLAGKTINGEAVRALCGAYFVPTQDHESMPRCPVCEELIAELPQ